MNNLQDVQFEQQFCAWQTKSAFNTHWQYSFLNREAFYSNVAAEYKEYMQRWVKHSLYWYDGWVPYFHSSTEGIFSTRIASALVDGAAKKVIGGRVFFKNTNKESKSEGTNEALQFIASDWAKKTKFSKEIKRATAFAAAAGTALLKLNKDEEGLWAEALRFDSFYPVVGARGKLLECICFLRNFTNVSHETDAAKSIASFYVVEHRYFGTYTRLDGTIIENAPLVEYKIIKSSGTITSGQDYSAQKGTRIKFCDLPRNVRDSIGRAYSLMKFDSPIILPFNAHLGAVLVNWTDGVSNIPELPFGDSLLANIMPYLQSWDYYFSAFNTDMYIGRGQVIMPSFMQKKSVNDNGGFYEGKFGLLFTAAPGGITDDQKPIPVQFDLRSTSWKEIRDMLMQNIAINTRMNISTIASFLQDTNGNKTAREISTEESETALFVDDKREIIERPINEILNIVLRYYGYNDDVVIRWAQAGLSNVYTRTEMIATAVQNGFCSKFKAIQMFDQDDDEYQIQEEYQRCLNDEQEKQQQQQGGGFWDEQDYFGDNNNPKSEGEGVGNEESVPTVQAE